MNHVAQRNQSGTMFSRDRGRSATYSGVTDRKLGSKLFVGELCRFQGHDPEHGLLSAILRGQFCSSSENKGRLSWRAYKTERAFLLLAPLRHADRLRKRLLIGVDRK